MNGERTNKWNIPLIIKRKYSFVPWISLFVYRQIVSFLHSNANFITVLILVFLIKGLNGIGFVSLEKSFLGKGGHSFSRVNFMECLNWKKVWPLWPSKDRSCMFWSSRLDWIHRLGEPTCINGEKLARLGGWSYHKKWVTLFFT